MAGWYPWEPCRFWKRTGGGVDMCGRGEAGDRTWRRGGKYGSGYKNKKANKYK